MTLRAPYTLVHSEFNAFLYAPIGDEGNGMVLSVFSALTRLDIDPWREAARLTALSKDGAVHALARLIASLPGERWKIDDAGEIAARLVAFLPQSAARADRPAAVGKTIAANSRMGLVVIGLVFGTALLLAGMFGSPSNPSDDTSRPASLPAVSAPVGR